MRHTIGGVRKICAALVFVVAIASACQSPPIVKPRPNPPDESDEISKVNQWIYDELKGWYYWNDAVKEIEPPKGSLEYDEFLQKTIQSLPWESVQDRSNGENPATIDGTWVNESGRWSRAHIYSYIEKFPAARTRASKSMATTFGFDAEPFWIGDSDRILLLVTWVMPDSPADKAGLERGVVILQYNDREIYMPTYEDFFYKLHFQEGGNTMSVTDKDGKKYELAAVEMRVSPILHHEVIETAGGAKVAYLVYNAFETGANNEFDNELRDVFGEFKAAGATELVLDLRYNSGGLVSSCRVLSSLAANVDRSQVFVKMKRNREINTVYPQKIANPEVVNFLTEPNSLGLNKIYVLATDMTASASEMVISSIRGVLGDEAVVLIGTQTNGKNVGMDLREKTIDGDRYEMWPITFKVLNAKDFCDYAYGFTPDVRVEEFWEFTNPDGSEIIYALGDSQERLLAATLRIIDGEDVYPDIQTRAGEADRPRPSSPVDPRRGGAKYIPENKQ
jgi:C-terminal processing protease CtpA/Prc